MPTLDPEHIQTVKEALAARNVSNVCLACGGKLGFSPHIGYLTMDSMSWPYNEIHDIRVLTARKPKGLPVVHFICANCGHVRAHSMIHLGLMDIAQAYFGPMEDSNASDPD